jgi:alkanesulfonate monooxygenase SsuD/methylene tetrahydromethanopterin reductase-like flavin-dependent oxidoreductase (luciferase family)
MDHRLADVDINVGERSCPRGKMLDDMLAFLHAWSTTWDSDFFTLPPVHADLCPVQVGGPPIWIGTPRSRVAAATRSPTVWSATPSAPSVMGC